MNKIGIKAVVFDMDGLVLDSETTYKIAWQQAVESMGYRIPASLLTSLSGMTGESVERLLLKHYGEDFDVQHFKRVSAKCWSNHVKGNGIPIKKGFLILLHTLKQLQLPFCLATNSRRREALQCLELAGLDEVFKHIVTRDEVPNGKPAPDIFLECARTLGVSIPQCLVLEDSAVGVKAAIEAKAMCICIPSVRPLDSWLLANNIHIMADLEQVASYISAGL